MDTPELRGRLESATTEFWGSSKRAGATSALDAVITYLSQLNIEARLRTPLLELLAALNDAEAGRSNPITERATHKGGLKKPAKYMLDWSTASAVVTLFMEAGLGLGDAIERVAKQAKLDHKKLADYRSNVVAHKLSQEAIEQYKFSIEAAKGFDVSPIDRAETALSFLQSQVGSVDRKR